MKLTHTALFISCCMASTFSNAEIDLPHALSTSLTVEEMNENLAALSDAANTALADIEALQQVTTTKVLERMTAGDEITLLTQGDTTVKASCVFNNGSESSEGFELELWTESTAAGTLAVNYDVYGGYYGEEGNQTSTWVSWSTGSDTDTNWDNEIDQGLTVSPTGHVVMMDGESFGYGINVQGSDCLITGQISSFQGEEAPDSFDASLVGEDDSEDSSEFPQ